MLTVAWSTLSKEFSKKNQVILEIINSTVMYFWASLLYFHQVLHIIALMHS